MVQEGDEKGAARFAYAVDRDKPSLLQTLNQGGGNGSFDSEGERVLFPCGRPFYCSQTVGKVACTWGGRKRFCWGGGVGG